MKLHKLIIAAIFLAIGWQSSLAQDFTKIDSLCFYDALQFRIINKAFDNSLTPFTRIPAYLRDSVRSDLWERAKCSTGMAIRFSTDSRAVAVRYNLLTNMHMPHMADTGIKGTDLYILDEETGRWVFLNCNRPYRDYSGETPRKDSIQKKVMIDRLDGRMHEYMLYLPLYDGINWLQIGVDSTAVMQMPQTENPRRGKKFVFYGTSVLQGGCACRPGMVATSILQRDLGVECVNIGISGEGKMDYCMARAMATIPDVEAFIIDPVPNCTQGMCDTLTYNFINILRKARPEVPIIMVEGQKYSYEDYNSFYNKYLKDKNSDFHRNFLRLKKDNPSNIYYVDRDNLWGPDNEGTVDGIHLTDIGFYFYARKLKPYLEAILNHAAVPYQDKVMNTEW